MQPLRLTLAAVLVALACSPSAPPDGPRGSVSADSPSAAPAASTLQPFPAVGLAVVDTTGRWCASFPDSVPALTAGTRLTIAFAERAAVPAQRARATRLREAPCATAFAQPGLADHRAYDLEIDDASQADAGDLPMAALAVVGDANWSRGTDGVLRADLDGDGVAEEIRVCAADEGQHFTLWSGSGATRRRRAHAYFDWGALVDVTCAAGERGAGVDTGTG